MNVSIIIIITTIIIIRLKINIIIVRATFNSKADKPLALIYPDRIGIWSVGLSLCITLSMKDIENALHH